MNVTLARVREVYAGPERQLWELLMGEQIHIGGFESSEDLAIRAGITNGMAGVDLCCCTGAGMRFLVLIRGAARMTGVDATPQVISVGETRNRLAGVAERIGFVEAHACFTGLPDNSADFVWGEDAWCYVDDKAALLEEAVRIVKAGGVIAFTDWVAGPEAMTGEDRKRLLDFMKFPNLWGIHDYSRGLATLGCDVLVAEDTGRFAPFATSSLAQLSTQFHFDALRILGGNTAAFEAVLGEMRFLAKLAESRRIVQARFVARTK